MQNLFFLARNFLKKEISSLSVSLFVAGSFTILAGCGSGPDVPKSTSTATTTGTVATPAETIPTVTAAAPNFTLTLTNAAGAAVSTISNGAPATLKATLKNAAGAVVPNTVVTFSTDGTLATIAPSATALTNASGVATITLSPATILAAGATTVQASAQVGTLSVTDSVGFSVGTAAVTVTAPVLGVGTAQLSAFGTTSISVSVAVGGVAVTTPQNVTFSSICATAGKAVLSSAVATVNGTAVGSYRDNGCASTDVVTASAAGVTSTSTNLVVTPPTTGSIQFVSANPASLSLKGNGGAEASQVSFKVLDASGKPLSGKTVTFGLSTTVGGIGLTPSVSGVGTAVSDASGLVLTTVNTGTVSTPVRVTASTVDTSTAPATTLTTQSSGLTISTGIPDQDSFSLSATKLNPEFMDIDGNTTVLTARLADHFNNPAPDGTVVNFTTEGGSVVSSCTTVGGLCSSTLTSQAPRPANGRVTVLAYAVGEESFIDLNGNGAADLVPNEMVDINGKSTDMPEAFRDDNESGTRDVNETFIDFNKNGSYDGPDGKFNGVLCDNTLSSSGTCSATKSINVRKDIVIIFSGSTAVISKIAPAGDIDLVGGCKGTSVRVDLRIVDVTGNPLPVGTTIDIATSNGTISSGSAIAPPGFGLSLTQGNTNVTPATGAANYSVSIRDDSYNSSVSTTVGGVTTTSIGPCVDEDLSGVLTVKVATPSGATTIQEFAVKN